MVEVNQLLESVSSYPEEQLNQPGPGGGWSAMQTMHHLILTEEFSLKYVQKKLSFNPKLERKGIKTFGRIVALVFYLKAPFKFKAPPAVNSPSLPEKANFEETSERWKKIMKEWEQFFSNLDPALLNKAVYRHPFAGRLSWSGTILFLSGHFKRHRKQALRALS